RSWPASIWPSHKSTWSREKLRTPGARSNWNLLSSRKVSPQRRSSKRLILESQTHSRTLPKGDGNYELDERQARTLSLLSAGGGNPSSLWANISRQHHRYRQRYLRRIDLRRAGPRHGAEQRIHTQRCLHG